MPQYEQKEPPEMLYKKVVLKDFAKFTDFAKVSFFVKF